MSCFISWSHMWTFMSLCVICFSSNVLLFKMTEKDGTHFNICMLYYILSSDMFPFILSVLSTLLVLLFYTITVTIQEVICFKDCGLGSWYNYFLAEHYPLDIQSTRSDSRQESYTSFVVSEEKC